jgi:enoyl-CoA hydratase/3-hydroxyacyl-CoA dehydrogenase
MKLVEIVRGGLTNDHSIQVALNVAKRLGKETVLVNKDMPGFIVNRILYASFSEAFWCIYRGETTAQQIDDQVRVSGIFPMGLLELADYIGIDLINQVSKILYRVYGERLNPSPLIESMVRKGALGKKSSHGFYSWSGGKAESLPRSGCDYDIEGIYGVIANEGSFMVSDDVASVEDIDRGMKLGTNWKKGPCEIADEVGIDRILNILNKMYEKHHDERYEPCPLLEIYTKRNWLGKGTKKGFYEYQQSSM